MTLLPKTETMLVALTYDDGSVGVMQFVTKDHRGIQQLATRANVDAQIAKNLEQSRIALKEAIARGAASRSSVPLYRPVKSWRFITRAEYRSIIVQRRRVRTGKHKNQRRAKTRRR